MASRCARTCAAASPGPFALACLALLHAQARAPLAPRPCFVHVGKAGGGTIRSFLDANRLVPHEYHLKPLPRDHLRRGVCSSVVVSLRDPVDRAVSAFNWRHFVGGKEHVPRSAEDLRVETQLYGCFPNVTAFAQAFLRPASTDNCTRLARWAVRPNVRPRDFPAKGHLWKGFRYHLMGAMSRLRHQPLFVARVAHMDDDLRAIPRRLGRTLRVDPADMPKAHGEYPLARARVEDADAKEALRAALKFEYDVVAKIEALALNGSKKGKG